MALPRWKEPPSAMGETASLPPGGADPFVAEPGVVVQSHWGGELPSSLVAIFAEWLPLTICIPTVSFGFLSRETMTTLGETANWLVTAGESSQKPI